ncbi:MAG: Type secretion system protein precursor [Planctomycetota bacterium]
MTKFNTDMTAALTTNPRTTTLRRFAFIATAAACALHTPAWAQGAKPAAGSQNQAGTAQVKPTEGQAVAETFTVQFQDTDILQALQMLSMQGRRNIVAAKGVSGTVTANLFDVTVMEALDVLLRANDLRMEEAGNFIYVYTRDEWEEISRSRMKKASRNFPLEYLNAKDAGEFIAPLLSEGGKVSFVGDVEKGFQPSSTDGGSDSWAFQGMLVVSDFPENLKAIETLLTEIDTPPAQVVVESTIVSSKVDQKDGFGVDVSVIGNLDVADLTNPLSGANDLFTGDVGNNGEVANSVNTAVAGWDRESTLRVGVVSDDVSVFLRMLDSVTDTTVLARPRVMALNRQRAQILIGRRVGYLTSTTTQTSTTQSVEFLDSGIKLIFRPFISSDGSIRMELAPSLSDAKIENLTDSQGSELPVPNEDTSEIVTNVRVKSGQTLVLGGLFKEDTKIERRQVPGLGDVPILGNAFKGYDDELKREEIIFLVTPTIVKDDVAKVWADEAEQFASAVRIGSREGLLPWSRDSLTTAQNQQAIEALAKGDRDLAMHHIENSLRLSHNQPEIIRMREELRSGGSAAQADYERSMLQRMIEMKLGDPSTAEPAKQSSADPSTSNSSTMMTATETSASDASSSVASNAALSLDMETAAETTATTANAAIELEPQMVDEAKPLMFETAELTQSDAFSVLPRVPAYLEWSRWTPAYFGEIYWDRIAAISESDAQ